MSRKTAFFTLSTLTLCIILAGPAPADIATGLVGYWPLDGDAVDASGNGHDGTINGNVTIVADRHGNPDAAMSFPGSTSSYIDLGQPPALLIKGAMTVAVWVRADRLDQTGRIIAKQGPSSGRSWGLNLETAGFARFDIGVNPTERVRVDSEPLSFGPDEWFHLAGVFRPGEAGELYINSEMVKSEPTAVTTQWIENDLPINIGRRPSPGTPWYGDIDEARMYARALSPDDVKELYAYIPSPRLNAWTPQPADGTVGVTIALFQWKPGATALLHDVYLGTSPELTEADLVSSRMPMTLYYHAPALEPGTTYFWRVDEIEADMVTVHTGEVWSFVVQDITAYLPDPADGAADVSSSVTLSWLPGQAAIEHQVYLSDDLDAVTQGAAEADRGTTKETSLSPESLENATTYYWRVDETVAIGPAQTGPVWSFATYLPVEDFESYTDEEGSRIYEAWIDGWTNDTGSTVGYLEAPFAEQNIVHSGGQSMPLDYNNVNAPYYAEAEREFDPTQDWTTNGLEALTISIWGRSTNGDDVLSIVVEDSAGHEGTVACPDAAIIKTAAWTDWRIPFSEFTAAGVNLTRVKKLYIVVGDKANPAPGGSGVLYIDDIRLVKPSPLQ